MEPITMPEHPRGITIVTILLAIQGMLELTLAGLALSGAVVPARGAVSNQPIAAFLPGTVGDVSLVLGLFVLLLAWGLWTLRHWAFWLMLLLQIIMLGTAAADLFALRTSIATIALVAIGNILIPLVVLLYCWRDRSIRALFQS